MTETSPVDAHIMRRHLVAITTGTYEDERYESLEGITDQLGPLTAWWAGDQLGVRAFTPAYPGLAKDPDENAIRAAFRNPKRPNRAWTPGDAAVVFVTGHGVVADRSHWLVLSESDGDDLPGTALKTVDLISWLHRPGGIEHLLLVVDACFSGEVVEETFRFDRPLPESWLIIPSVTRDGKAVMGALTAAITRAVEFLGSGMGVKHGVHQRFFTVATFLDTVAGFLPTDQKMDRLYRGLLGAEHVCLPNPHYLENDNRVPAQTRRHDLALPQDDLDTHWCPRARGDQGADGRWLFTGRADLMRELIRIVDRRPPQPDGHTRAPQVTVVTGGAGCGKSAVLARLVTLSDPDFLAAYADQVAQIPKGLRPDPEDVDVAVLATGKRVYDVLGQISDAIGADRPERDRGDATLESRITACRTALDARAATGGWVTVVVDALDEADEPLGIARMLAQLTKSRGLRLLVGVRSPAGPDDPLAGSGAAGPLADQVEKLLTAHRLRTDEEPWWHQDDIRAYAASVLQHTTGSPYRSPEHHQQADQLTEVIAKEVGRSFLVARLAATALTQRPDLVDPDDPDWRATLTAGVIGVFRADLIRLYPDPDARLAAVELLRAVAFGYARNGLPWGEIWPLVANAVADRQSKYGDRDIAALLASPIAGYLTIDQEDGVTVYRLFHDALRDTLRKRWRDLLQTPQPGVGP